MVPFGSLEMEGWSDGIVSTRYSVGGIEVWDSCFLRYVFWLERFDILEIASLTILWYSSMIADCSLIIVSIPESIFEDDTLWAFANIIPFCLLTSWVLLTNLITLFISWEDLLGDLLFSADLDPESFLYIFNSKPYSLLTDFLLAYGLDWWLWIFSYGW